MKQLGHDTNNYVDKQYPKIIKYFIANNISISQIASGEHHNLVLSVDGNVRYFVIYLMSDFCYVLIMHRFIILALMYMVNAE